MENYIGVLVSAIYIAIVVGCSKFVNKFGEEASRKFVHIMLANVWFFYVLFINSMVFACVLPAIFVVVNYLSYKFKLIKSIEREENDGYGTVYYALSLLVLAIFSYNIGNPLVALPGILIMGYGDGFAAIIGKKISSKKYRIGNTIKSFAGSFTMFLISFFISIIILTILNAQFFLIKGLMISVVATILEAISIKGLDNITVPIFVTILVFLAV